MVNNNGYIMKEQVRNQIPAIMKHELQNRPRQAESQLHLLSVAVVTLVYLVAMAISG